MWCVVTEAPRFVRMIRIRFFLCLSTQRPERSKLVFRVFSFLLSTAERAGGADRALSWGSVRETRQRERYVMRLSEEHYIRWPETQLFAPLCVLSGRRYVYTFWEKETGAGEFFGDIPAVVAPGATPRISEWSLIVHAGLEPVFVPIDAQLPKLSQVKLFFNRRETQHVRSSSQVLDCFARVCSAHYCSNTNSLKFVYFRKKKLPINNSYLVDYNTGGKKGTSSDRKWF